MWQGLTVQTTITKSSEWYYNSEFKLFWISDYHWQWNIHNQKALRMCLDILQILNLKPVKYKGFMQNKGAYEQCELVWFVLGSSSHKQMVPIAFFVVSAGSLISIFYKLLTIFYLSIFKTVYQGSPTKIWTLSFKMTCTFVEIKKRAYNFLS